MYHVTLNNTINSEIILCETAINVTSGNEVMSMTEHTDALIPVKSAASPAKMAPIIPPTSK